MGIDSVMGLLYLLKAPEISLEAITIVHGIADVKPAARNAMRILQLTGDNDIPVAQGRSRPLEGRREIPVLLEGSGQQPRQRPAARSQRSAAASGPSS